MSAVPPAGCHVVPGTRSDADSKRALEAAMTEVASRIEERRLRRAAADAMPARTGT